MGRLIRWFEMIDAEIRYLLEDYVPSIKTGLRLPSGVRIDLYGLHPKPPFMQDTKRRDAELLIAGREVRGESSPAIVAGDLNDVAWSRSTRLFQEISGLLDPRIGRIPPSMPIGRCFVGRLTTYSLRSHFGFWRWL